MRSPISEASGLQFPFGELPAPGHALEVAPGVHWVRMTLPFALNHINLWLLEDGRDWMVVDTGLGNEPTRALWMQVFERRLGGAPVSRVLVTHCHPDHAGNAAWLTERYCAPLLMAQGEFLTAHAFREGSAGFSRESTLALLRRNGLDEASASGLFGGGNAYRKRVPEFPDRYRRLLDGERLSIGAREWRVMMGYGHAPEHAALYCEALGVLISGDMVLPKITTNVSVPTAQPDSNPLKLFLDSVTRYAALPADTLVLPSHGTPFRGLRERVAQLEQHHKERLAELLAACESPKSAAEVLPTLFRRELDTQQVFFAMGEAMAHLHYLHEDGALQRADADGVIRYVQRP